jgi:hypothetical protein
MNEQRKVRRAVWLLQLVRIRQTARKAFDLARLGNGPLERLCSALILGAVFFFTTLLLCHLVQLPSSYVVGLSSLGLVSVMTASAVLVLGKTDAQLEVQGARLAKELPELRAAALQARAERDAECLAALEAKLESEAERDAEEDRQAALRAARRPTSKRCPYCREVIRIDALKCKHCGEILDEDLRHERRPRPQQRWNPGVAAVLSFFWPGLGQMYKGQVLNGFAWMFVVLIGYICCVFPGFFLHVFCIFGAASGSEN